MPHNHPNGKHNIRKNDAFLDDYATAERIRPVRNAYRHIVCDTVNTTATAIAETLACDPNFYQKLYCSTCNTTAPIAQFLWDDGSGDKVGD